MAHFSDRVPQNAAGRFYVDWSCIYCDLCHQMAPTLFIEHSERGWAFVARQPATPDEITLCIEAAEACPTESIGTDGHLHDWSSPSTATK